MDRLCIFILFYSVISATALFTPTDADARTYSRRLTFQEYKLSTSSTNTKPMKRLKLITHLNINDPPLMDSSSLKTYYVNSPLFLPPFDSLSPLPLPSNPPPPWANSQPPSRTPNTNPTQSPPTIIWPIPPSYGPTPPRQVPSPPKYGPSPPVYLPPVVFPPPSAPPPPHKKPVESGVWCVAKPTVPDPIMQEAMDYACSRGGDCKPIQPNGPCYQPETLLAHASFAFNSYWQRTKVGGGTCDFGGTAMLVTVDPSFDGCSFIVN